MQKELKILLLTSALFSLAGGLFGPIYAVFVENIGGDLLTAGTAYSVFAIAAGILIFFLGRWEDHVKHQEKLVVIGNLISFFGFIGYLMIRNPIDLFIVQLVFGIGQAIGTPAFDGLYSRHLDKGKYASEWSLWECMQWVVLGVASGLGGFVASTYGFRSLFSMMLILSLLGLIISFFLVTKNSFKSKKIKQK